MQNIDETGLYGRVLWPFVGGGGGQHFGSKQVLMKRFSFEIEGVCSEMAQSYKRQETFAGISSSPKLSLTSAPSTNARWG